MECAILPLVNAKVFLDHPTLTPGATSPVIPRQSERLSQPPERYSPGIFFTDAGEPTSYEEASTSPYSATWHLAMESEMHSIRANKTWDLVELPKNRRVLLCKWVYRLKETSDSTNPKYKARLVAKGFRQEYGVNFDEIFSPVVKMTTLLFMLVVMAANNLELIQLDVKTTFLHGDL